MKNEYNPPIKERDTKELLSIVENTDDWKEDALSQARKELVTRGYSIQNQENRAKSKRRYIRKTTSIKANSTYSTKELLALYFFAPFILLVYWALGSTPTGDTFLELRDNGYNKKWKQRLLMTTLGNLSWFLLLALVLEHAY